MAFKIYNVFTIFHKHSGHLAVISLGVLIGVIIKDLEIKINLNNFSY